MNLVIAGNYAVILPPLRRPSPEPGEEQLARTPRPLYLSLVLMGNQTAGWTDRNGGTGGGVGGGHVGETLSNANGIAQA